MGDLNEDLSSLGGIPVDDDSDDLSRLGGIPAGDAAPAASPSPARARNIPVDVDTGRELGNVMELPGVDITGSASGNDANRSTVERDEPVSYAYEATPQQRVRTRGGMDVSRPERGNFLLPNENESQSTVYEAPAPQQVRGVGSPDADPSVGTRLERFLSETLPAWSGDQGGAFATGIGQGMTLGHLDELAGAVDAASGNRSYTEGRDRARDMDARVGAAYPTTHLVGDVVGGALPAAFIPGAPAGLGRVARVGRAAAIGTGLGAVAGEGHSRGETAREIARDSAGGAIVGGLFGGGSEGAVQAGGAILRAGARGARNLYSRAAQRVARPNMLGAAPDAAPSSVTAAVETATPTGGDAGISNEIRQAVQEEMATAPQRVQAALSPGEEGVRIRQLLADYRNRRDAIGHEAVDIVEGMAQDSQYMRHAAGLPAKYRATAAATAADAPPGGADVVWEGATTAIDRVRDLAREVEQHSHNYSSAPAFRRLARDIEGFQRDIDAAHGAGDSHAILQRLDELKRRIGSVAANSRDQNLADALQDEIYPAFRSVLENEGVTGAGWANIQRPVNAAWTRMLGTNRRFEGQFMTPYDRNPHSPFDSGLAANSSAVVSALEGAGTAAGRTAERTLREHPPRVLDFIRAVQEGFDLAGNEGVEAALQRQASGSQRLAQLLDESAAGRRAMSDLSLAEANVNQSGLPFIQRMSLGPQRAVQIMGMLDRIAESRGGAPAAAQAAMQPAAQGQSLGRRALNTAQNRLPQAAAMYSEHRTAQQEARPQFDPTAPLESEPVDFSQYASPEDEYIDFSQYTQEQ